MSHEKGACGSASLHVPGWGSLARYPQLLPGRGLGLLPRLRGALPVRVFPRPRCCGFPPLPGLSLRLCSAHLFLPA